jgi:hypothetical protein
MIWWLSVLKARMAANLKSNAERCRIILPFTAVILWWSVKTQIAANRSRGRTMSKDACITLLAVKAVTRKCPRLSLRVTGRFSVLIDRSIATYAVHSYTTGTGINIAEMLAPLSVYRVLVHHWDV